MWNDRAATAVSWLRPGGGLLVDATGLPDQYYMKKSRMIRIIRGAIKALESKPNFVVRWGRTSAMVIDDLKDLMEEIENDATVQKQVSN